MKRKININELIWLVILAAFSIMFYILVYSGDLTYFIHPKMIKFTYFSIFIIALMAIEEGFILFSRRSKMKFKSGYLLFIFVLIIGLGVRPKGLEGEVASTKGVNLLNNYANHNLTVENNIDRSSNLISINEKNYLMYLRDININLDKYLGKEVTFTGFIYKDSSYEKEEFVSARMLISCCAADAEVIGFLCNYKDCENLKVYNWTNIKGKLTSKIVYSDNKKVKIPLIQIESINYIKEPLQKYIYE